MPQLQPVKLTSKRKTDLALYLSEEIHNTIGDRAELERRWENYLIQCRAQLPDNTLEFPWPGAPNVEMPLTDMHFQPIQADLLQTLHSPEDYWTPQARRKDRVQHVTALRRGLTALDRRYLKMKAVNTRATLDQIILGTSIYKNHWRSERRTVRDYAPSGEIERRTRTISQPSIEHVPLQRFYIPANAWEIDPDVQGGAQWVAQAFFKTRAELHAWAQGGDGLPGFDSAATKRVMNYAVDRVPEVDREVQQEDDYVPFRNEKIRLFEVHARYDIDGNGFEEDVVAVFHLESMELLRVLHNPLLHGRRPFHKNVYLPFFGFYGRGIAEIDEWAQDTATMLMNAQLHNVILANSRMYSAPLGSGIQPGEPIYPGKVWLLGPDEAVGEIRMSDIYSSLPNAIGMVQQYADLRSGISELRQGDLSGLPSRTPATSLLSILREGNKRFDMILSGMRDVHSEMGLRTLQNLAQYARDDAITWQRFFAQAIGEQHAAQVMEVLAGPVHEIEEAFGIAVTATSAQVNKEVEKQAFIGLLQIVAQIGGQLTQVAGLVQQTPPGTPMYETGAAMYAGGVELLKQLLQRFDIQNPEQYLGNMEVIAGALTQQQQGGNAATAGMAGASAQSPFAGMQASQIPPQLLNGAQLGGLFGF